MLPSAPPTVPMAVKMDLEMQERIKRPGDARHRSVHWMMKEAIRQFVEREEQRAAFRQDGFGRGKPIRPTDCTRRWKRLMPGWPAWKPVKT